MKRIYTCCLSIEDALALAHFILARGYEGVQNDSFRYCDTCIEVAFYENARHHRSFIYVGVNGYQLVVGKCRKSMRTQGSYRFIEKERIFREILEYY